MESSTTRVDAQDPTPQTGATPSKTRVDMHCHSTASEISKLGVQRALGLPECATPPEEVYELAKRRGMDFVTITDHDTIEGVLQIADRPDVFVSEELTAHFRGEPQAVHVLCYGITVEDHEWLQANSGDVELCAMYMYDRDIACALAHPYYAVGAPLSARHRRRLAELFEVWETRNGARAKDLNRPAAMYVATLDGTGIGGSDDHAGVDIGRTWTEAPAAETPEEFLAHMRAGNVAPKGKQGSAAKWAHAAIALAARSLGHAELEGDPAKPDPIRVMRMIQRLLKEGDAREGATRGRPGPRRRALPAEGLAGGGRARSPATERGLIAYMQEEGFSHSDLYRKACRLHERKLREAVEAAVRAIGGAPTRADRRGRRASSGEAEERAHGHESGDTRPGRRRGGAVRKLHRGDPVCAGDGFLGQRAGQAGSLHRKLRRRAAEGGDLGRRDRLDPWGEPHDRRDQEAGRAGL